MCGILCYIRGCKVQLSDLQKMVQDEVNMDSKLMKEDDEQIDGNEELKVGTFE